MRARREKLGGIAVHIGARVAASAHAGEVLVSSTVKDLVAGSGIEFEDRGEHTKGLPVNGGSTPCADLSDKEQLSGVGQLPQLDPDEATRLCTSSNGPRRASNYCVGVSRQHGPRRPVSERQSSGWVFR